MPPWSRITQQILTSQVVDRCRQAAPQLVVAHSIQPWRRTRVQRMALCAVLAMTCITLAAAATAVRGRGRSALDHYMKQQILEPPRTRLSTHERLHLRGGNHSHEQIGPIGVSLPTWGSTPSPWGRVTPPPPPPPPAPPPHAPARRARAANSQFTPPPPTHSTAAEAAAALASTQEEPAPSLGEQAPAALHARPPVAAEEAHTCWSCLCQMSGHPSLT